jgi:alpha-mannosidase
MQGIRNSGKLEIVMIGNAHIDPAWMWEWGEGMEAFIATCRSALTRMDETPGFTFSCSSAAHYAWVERADPELFDRIRKRVVDGSWEVVGGWWTQADCNLPSGEGLIRQGELAQAWFIEKFGRPATVGYSPDAFGHSAGLPQVLRFVGLDSYIFCRPDPTELELPGPLFRWSSTDGSEVLAYRVPFHYNMYQTTVRKKVADLRTAFTTSSSLAADQRHLSDLKSSGEWALFYGVGNHGGGPTREQIREIGEIRDEGEVAIGFGRLDRFFAGVSSADRDLIATMSGGIQMNSPGTFSVHTTMKRLNRRSESELCRAEAFDSLAARLDPGYRKRNSDVPERLRSAWRAVCFNHFHDILCGVAIPAALENAEHRYGTAIGVADDVTAFALRSIARRIDTSKQTSTIIAFNPHGFEFDGMIDVELWHDIDKRNWGLPIDLRITDSNGEDQIVQRIETAGKIGDDRVGVRFRGTIPPLGWNSWSLRYGESGDPTHVGGGPDVSVNLLQNQHLRVEFANNSAGFTRLMDRSSGIDFLVGEGGLPVRIDDSSDTWGHGVDRFDRQSRDQPALISSEVVASGELSATLRRVAECRSMKVIQWFTIHQGLPWIDVRCRIENREEGMVKLSFATAIDQGREGVASALYDTAVWPADGRERPAGAWKGIRGKIGQRSVALGISDTLTHGFSVHGGNLQLSLLRSVPYATHEPHPFNSSEDCRLIDIGTVEFTYRIRPIVDLNPEQILERDGLELNRPPIAITESPHDGGENPLPRCYSGIRISDPSVNLTTCRREEDETTTLRLYESSGKPSTTIIESALFDVSLTHNLRGHEVGELRIQN